MDGTHKKSNDKEKTPSPTTMLEKAGKQEHVSLEVVQKHMKGLTLEMEWLDTIIKARLKESGSLAANRDPLSVPEIAPLPELPKCSYGDFVKNYDLSYIERLVLMLAFVADFDAVSFNQFLMYKENENPYFNDYGGVVSPTNHRFFPTRQTALFLLGGHDRERRGYYQPFLTEHSRVLREQIVTYEYYSGNQAHQKDPIFVLEPSYLHYFIAGIMPRLDYGERFPARLLETDKEFSDLVLAPDAMSKLESVMKFIKHNVSFTSNPDVHRKLSPGYVIMLYGPPGTGKTMTAAVLGKECGVPVYRVDLSGVISKYIGETEKNLERVFRRYEKKNVILFFDEADALFGKRTEIADAKDRYANQEVSYLLQRLEEWNGLAIMATNLHQNFDDAFKRRIIKYIYLAPPGVEERELLWRKTLPDPFTFESDELPKTLAENYPFTGAEIMTVLKLACIEAMSEESTVITVTLLKPILKELCFQQNIEHKPL